MTHQQLLEDYQRRLKTITDELKPLRDKGIEVEKQTRLGIKASCYRTIISELEKVIEDTGDLPGIDLAAFAKKCFYAGFEKCKNDDANCYTAWREEAANLLNN